MASENISIRYMSWKELHRALITLAKRLYRDGFIPDIIFAVLKGGLIPARILSDLVQVDEIGFIGVKFYKAVGTRMAKPHLTLPPTHRITGLNVLVVDDVVESGRTLQLVIEELSRYEAKEIRSLTLLVKPQRTISPDYYYEETSQWVLFPWEYIETIRDGVDIRSSVGEDKDLVEEILRRGLLTKNSFSV